MSPGTRARGKPRKDGRRTLLLCGLLAALTLAAYGRAWDLGFTNYDDPQYVVHNAHVLAGLRPSGIAWAFTTTTETNWHPLTWLSLMLDASIGGRGPRVYHATNLLLHLANTLLLFLLLARTTGFRGRSAFVAALFAVHPLHVESVAWVAERKDVLSTLFWLLATAAYVRYAARPSLGRYAAVFALLALGLMAKPMLVTLPLVLLLLDLWPLGRFGLDPGTGKATPLRVRSLLLEKLPLLALAASSGLVTLLVQRPAMKVLEGLSFRERAANAVISYVAYMGSMIAPRRLAVFYPHPRGTIPIWELAAAAVLLVGLSLAAVLLIRSRPWFTVGWLWYAVTLVPVIGLVQVGQQARADRYTYVPLVGLFIVVAWGIPDLAARLAGHTRHSAPLPRGLSGGDAGGLAPAPHQDRIGPGASAGGAGRVTPLFLSRILAAGAAAVVLLLAGATWVQVGYWRSGIDLFTHALEARGDGAFAHYELSTEFDEAGDAVRAVAHLREALRIRPLYADAHFSLTRHLMREGKIDEAAALCRAQQAAWPSDSRTLVDLGVLATLQGRNDEAARWFQEALRIDPEAADARHNLEVIRMAGEEQAVGQVSDALRRGDLEKLLGRNRAGASTSGSGGGPR